MTERLVIGLIIAVCLICLYITAHENDHGVPEEIPRVDNFRVVQLG